MPGCAARTVQTPLLLSVMVCPFVPLAVHTDGVVVVNLTARPDEAVALTVNGDCANLRFANAPNVMV